MDAEQKVLNSIQQLYNKEPERKANDPKIWTVDIRGPNGVKTVEISDHLVNLTDIAGNKYLTAVRIACAELLQESNE